MHLGTKSGRQERTMVIVSTNIPSQEKLSMYLAAWGEIFSFGKDALVVVDVVLPTMLSPNHLVSNLGRMGLEVDLFGGH